MIRQATLSDIDIIVRFNTNLAKETEGIELNKERLKYGVETIISDSSKGIYYLYEIKDKVVGQIMITTEWSDWRNGYFWWIQSVYVEKSFRRQGVFQSLYKYVKSIASIDPLICGIRLYVEKENKTAQLSYKKLGMYETQYLLYEWEK